MAKTAVTMEQVEEVIEQAVAAEEAGSVQSIAQTVKPVHTVGGIKDAARLSRTVTVGVNLGMQVICQYDKGAVPAHTLIVNGVVVDEPTLARMLDRAQRR
ncbi:hypothetical protein [Paraburkholderia caffeinilytica]|uniref:hypothetical protein n=1 Tax=Paraburkholderia caffeinilytica TaxID=1761016 RepID=UPI003DA1A4BB